MNNVLRPMYLICQISPIFTSGHGDTSYNFREVKKTEEKILLVKASKCRKESFVAPTNIKYGVTSIPAGHH